MPTEKLQKQAQAIAELLGEPQAVENVALRGYLQRIRQEMRRGEMRDTTTKQENMKT